MYITDYKSLYVFVNAGLFLVQILAKIPEVRSLGDKIISYYFSRAVISNASAALLLFSTILNHQMHRVRLFGINSTPGIDSKIEYSPKKTK
jgi:hypothetical protein